MSIQIFSQFPLEIDLTLKMGMTGLAESEKHSKMVLKYLFTAYLNPVMKSKDIRVEVLNSFDMKKIKC